MTMSLVPVFAVLLVVLLPSLSSGLFLPGLPVIELPGFGVDENDARRANEFSDRSDRPPIPKPIFDQIFEPLLGNVGTTQFLTEQVGKIGTQINRGIDLIHDIDHGLRICNQKEPDNEGICYIGRTCSDLDGFKVGTCDVPTPKNTCCKFERTCGEVSKETVTYFRSPRNFNSAQTCDFVVRARHTTCQMRIDFVDLQLDPPDKADGVCTPTSFFRVINKLEGQGFGRDSSIFCGTNTGNHIYVPIRENDQEIRLQVRHSSRAGISFNIKVTQIYCESGVPDMQLLKAPDGCLQYHYKTTGTISSFNLQLGGDTFPMPPNQDYAICFRSNSSICGVALGVVNNFFNVPAGPAECETGLTISDATNAPCCAGAAISVSGALTTRGEPIGRDRFCGTKFANADNVVVSLSRPLMLRVETGAIARKVENTGFWMRYQLIPCP